MIKLTKPEINSLIINYFKQESFIYSSFVFKNEIKDEVKSVRKDISLERILTYGLQYMYGVEHYKDGKINVCSGVYSLDRLHLCDVVVKKKKKKKKGEEENEGTRKRRRGKQIIELRSEEERVNEMEGDDEKMDEEEEDIKDDIQKIKEEKTDDQKIHDQSVNKINDQNVNKISNISKEDEISELHLSPHSLTFNVKSLAPCKPCQYATLYEEFLYLYAPSSLYTFKFGSFVGVKNINISNMIYTDDILIMYDSTKIVFYNTFNLKSKSVLHKCSKVLYDGSKFVTLNKDGTLSYFTRDGNKVLENIFIFSGIVDGCIEENTLVVWSNEGRVGMVNTKTQHSHHFNQESKDEKDDINKKDDDKKDEVNKSSYSFLDGVLYLVHKSGIGIYNTRDKTSSILKCTSEGVCKTKDLLLSYKGNILTVYNNNTKLIYDTKKEIKRIVNIKGNILIIYKDTLAFYDEEVRLMKEYECEDEILDVEIYEKEVCVLLKKESPFLLNL